MKNVPTGAKIVGSFRHERADGTLIAQGITVEGMNWFRRAYEAQRIRYAERHRDSEIPIYYRTGETPPHSVMWEGIVLYVKNLLRR